MASIIKDLQVFFTIFVVENKVADRLCDPEMALFCWDVKSLDVKMKDVLKCLPEALDLLFDG